MATGTWHVYSAAAITPAAQALRQGPPSVLRQALLQARARTLALADDYAAALGPAAAVPYAGELNPPLWELGHIAWFQEWWIARNRQRALGSRCDPAQPRTASLLPQADAWYDSSRVAHRSRWELPLPDGQGTRAYLARTLEQTLYLLAGLPEDAGEAALYFFRLVALHEQMHAEAAHFMGYQLGIALSEPLRPAKPLAQAGERFEGELELPAQRFRLGSAPGGFAFDNELPAREVAVGPAWIDAQPVTWERFLPFVAAGGYEEPRWWDAAGAAWRAATARRQPAALRRCGQGWEIRRGGCWQALAAGEPAIHLNCHEAQAWCRWAGRRLPSEAEWECAALTLPGFRWGEVWEWTASPFTPYPGFQPHPYRDYSAPWFGTRQVLRGASAATAPALMHPRYRNFFEPQRSDIFAGFRSCRAS